MKRTISNFGIDDNFNYNRNIRNSKQLNVYYEAGHTYTKRKY